MKKRREESADRIDRIWKGGKKLKLAILSMQRIVNYGSVLQAYSLREMVRNATGDQAVFLDIEDKPALESLRNTQIGEQEYGEMPCSRFDVWQRGRRWIVRKLSAYNKYLIRSFMRDELLLDETNSGEAYDCVIVGSDEVFNHAKGVRLQLHGNVRQSEKVISYAASCGSAKAEDVAQADAEQVKAAMRRYCAMSVRDQGTYQYVKAFYPGEIVRNLDPVLVGPLHERKPQSVNLKPYLLVYAYGRRIHTEEEINAIRAFAKEKHLLTVAVGGSQYWCDLYIPAAPFRMLDYFAAAEYVVTDTFHGVVFSVLHQRKFGVIVRKSNENKIMGLLSDLALEERCIHDLDGLSRIMTNEIDYEQVESILARERVRAQEYLRSNLLSDLEINGLGKNACKCTGCGACAFICPVGAIEMQPDDMGAKQPVISGEKCVHCGKCMQMCSKIEAMNGVQPAAAYAAFGSDAQMIQTSASGGVFAMLASDWIHTGGLVAGAVMELDQSGVKVHHILSDNEKDLKRMQGSKYVQSDAFACYDAVAKALKAGKRVLFSGTPCQTAAIRALTGDPDNLTTIDLICHGVPPVSMLNEYLIILAKRLRVKIKGLVFRDKALRKNYVMRVDALKGNKERSYYFSAKDLSYYKLFLSASIQRESCYHCPYASLNRCADITIGDYWGIEKAHEAELTSGAMPKRNDWSCILVNSSKGQQLIDNHSDMLNLYPSSAQWAAQSNEQLNAASRKPENRETLLALYRKKGYKAIDDAFVQDCGGRGRYMLRLMRNMYRNRRLMDTDRKHEN